MRWNVRTRTGIACAGMACLFTAYSIRLINLQVERHDEFASLAAQKHTIKQVIHARRGMILDRNGEILASNMPVRTVVADGSHITDLVKLAQVAAPYLGMSVTELEQKLRSDRKYIVVKKQLPDEKAVALINQLQAQNLRGLYFESDAVRVYPNGPMLGHVLGFLDNNGNGIQGVEKTLQEQLRGHDGYRYIERDRTGREIVLYRGQEEPAVDGQNVTLTIDMGLQAIVEMELDNSFGELKPATAVAVIMNPKTGEILAMTSRPSFDPNSFSEAPPEAMKNRAIVDMVEPGSTFKIVVASGALNEKTVGPNTQIFCENGNFSYAGRILRDTHGYGMLNPHDTLVKSSNIGSAKMALLMGDDKFYEYVRRFGFGERTGIELPGEIPGLVHPPHRWDKLTITRMPMGQSVAVTPLQIVTAMSTVANGGTLLKPTVISSISNEDGSALLANKPEIVREVMSREVARYVSDALTEVVSERGTATLAKVNGFSVAGKTGTAQKVDPKGGYTQGKYVVSFVGYLPAEDPKFVCLVLIDDPKLPSNMNYGGLVAAPIFSRIGERAARYLDLMPSQRAVPVQIAPLALRDNPAVLPD